MRVNVSKEFKCPVEVAAFLLDIDLEELLFQYKPETVNYALGHQDICYSNCSSPENMDSVNRPSSRCSVQSSVEDEIEEIRDKLNVTEIHKVVSRLRFILLEECKALTAMIKYLKGNVRQKHLTESGKSEPSLSELKELRGALQVDLKLFPSSLEASSPLPVKGMKNSSSRLPVRQRPDTLLHLTPPSVSRPLTPLCHFKPKPPCGQPHTKTSLFRTHSTHRLTSTSNKSISPFTCNSVESSGHPNSSLFSEQKTVQSKYHCCLPPEQDDAAGLRRRTCLNVHANSERNSPSLQTVLSMQCDIHRPSTEYELSLQGERKIDPIWSSRNTDITPLSAPASSPLCDAEGYSSNDMGISVPIKGKVRGQKIRNSGGSLVLTAEQTDMCLETKCSESLAICETLALDVRRNSDNGINENKHNNIKKHRNKQQSITSHTPTDWASHSPESSDTDIHDMCTVQQSAKIKLQSFTSWKKPHGGPTSQSRSGQETKIQPQFLSGFHQSVPPARVPT